MGSPGLEPKDVASGMVKNMIYNYMLFSANMQLWLGVAQWWGTAHRLAVGSPGLEPSVVASGMVKTHAFYLHDFWRTCKLFG